ncbi:hypothetical protein DRE_03855 [Drechslerella stenobrocha 248]|uniref:Pre-mRNA-splicing factor 38B n=1 Tax=Drechslerella stenobrocha 248 TaxID=1043628 RepID=W7I3P9_9PEZI|nr:hypothetical protein DRE_03855 [Drechslerella stenobrocha 248]
MADDDINDALAASLLRKEAAERSLRYSAFGLVAFAGDRKKPHSAPKPNTRFLRNLVKEADSHNTALLAKEAEESRLRLEKLRREERRRGVRERDRPREQRRRSRSKERRRGDRDDGEDGQRKRQKVGIGDIDRLLQASRREKRDVEKVKDSGRGLSKHHEDRKREKEDASHQKAYSRSRNDRHRHRHRSRSPRDREQKRHHARSRDRSVSSTSASPSPGRQRHRHRRRRRSRSRSRPASGSPDKRTRPEIKRRSKDGDEDDDPLAEYLGISASPEIGPSFPQPSNGVRSRGRGLPGSSAMDARFDPAYDPTLDVTPSNPADEDDWDAALEALRDRQRWKQQGRERLQAAGFDADFIEAWETNTTKDEARIKWSKDKGGRDWDRGKVVNEDTGEVQLKPSWG